MLASSSDHIKIKTKLYDTCYFRYSCVCYATLCSFRYCITKNIFAKNMVSLFSTFPKASQFNVHIFMKLICLQKLFFVCISSLLHSHQDMIFMWLSSELVKIGESTNVNAALKNWSELACNFLKEIMAKCFNHYVN